MHSFEICHCQKSLLWAYFISWSPEVLKIVEIILSITLCIGQHAQKPRARFPDDFALRIETAHCITALFIFAQNLRNELAFGQVAMLSFYVLIGGVHPKSQGVVHSLFHREPRTENTFSANHDASTKISIN